jgi:hypothetical protein
MYEISQSVKSVNLRCTLDTVLIQLQEPVEFQTRRVPFQKIEDIWRQITCQDFAQIDSLRVLRTPFALGAR